jgi:hypothetical protein
VIRAAGVAVPVVVRLSAASGSLDRAQAVGVIRPQQREVDQQNEQCHRRSLDADDSPAPAAHEELARSDPKSIDLPSFAYADESGMRVE